MLRFFAFLLLLAVARPAGAVPLFARVHGYSCNECHAPVPKLTEFGAEWSSNGFTPPDENPSPREFLDVGGDDLRLLRDFPLAARLDLAIDSRVAGGAGSVEFKAPWSLLLASGGRLADDIAYYVTVSTDSSNRIGVDDVYIHFREVFGSPIDVAVGQFEISYAAFNAGLRLTFQEYLPYAVRPGRTLNDLGFHRGIELSTGFDFGLDVTAIVVNGNGRDAAIAGSFDLDRYKHGLLHIGQRLGPVYVGMLGYYGREQLETSGARRNNYTTIAGPEVRLLIDRLELNAQYLSRWDTNPDFRAKGTWVDTRVQTVIAEAIVRIWGDPGVVYGVLLYNLVDSDDFLAATQLQEAYTANLTWVLHANVKLIAEYTFGWVIDGRQAREHRVTVGTMAAL